jgi:hypothetical protein
MVMLLPPPSLDQRHSSLANAMKKKGRRKIVGRREKK